MSFTDCWVEKIASDEFLVSALKLSNILAVNAYFVPLVVTPLAITSLAKVKAAGVEIIYPDKAAFAAAVQPLHQSLKGTEVGELMQQISQVQVETVAGVSND